MNHDLKLIVDEEQAEIMASYQVMSNASPVFRQMFQPNRFAEGCDIKRGGCLDLPLPDDPAAAMGILCNIIHLSTALVPRTNVTSDVLADLATLVDKYDCAIAIQPWPDIWIKQGAIQQELSLIEDMELSGLGKWIHISAHLDYEDIFFSFTSKLICKISADDFHQGPHLLDFHKLSQALQERIEDARRAGLESLKSICCALIEDLEQGNTCSFPDEELAFDCSSIALGNGLLALRSICGPDWRFQDWEGSILQRYQQLKSIGSKLRGPILIHTPSRGYRYGGTYGHECCALSDKFLDQIKETFDHAVRGLELKELGNHVYRVARELPQEK